MLLRMANLFSVVVGESRRKAGNTVSEKRKGFIQQKLQEIVYRTREDR
jgi:hypothetical protein